VNGPNFLELDAVLFLHGEAIREYGGYHGLRDEALLASALDRARNRLAYEEDADLATLAAAYAFGIARNHAFLDGNKRTAWACCVLFLKVNGLELLAPAFDAVEKTVALATGEMSEVAFAAWLREVCAS
jgi:death-on-curing protein